MIYRSIYTFPVQPNYPYLYKGKLTMYSTQLQETNTITWHNLHFLLEHHCKETLSVIEKIIVEQKYDDDKQSLQDFKKEIIGTIKTIEGIKTVVNHHRTIRQTA